MSHSPRRKQEKAEDLARQLVALQRIRGVVVADGGGVWLLGRPADRPRDPGLVARALGEELPGRAELAGALGCEEVTPLGPARLAKWEWALAALEGRRDLAGLVREGVRPLRGYRGVDFPQRLRGYRETLTRFKRLVETSAALTACQRPDAGELPAQVLVDALPGRLACVGAFPADPVGLLLRRETPADGLLLGLARDAGDPAVAALAAVLLGRRAARAGEQVPARLAPLLHAPAAHSPVLQALAFAAGRRPLPPLAGVPGAALEEVLLAGERAAVLFGVDVALRVLDNLARPFEGAIEEAGVFAGRSQAFLQHAEDVERGRAVRPRSADEAGLLKDLGRVRQAGQGGARLLVRLFLAWVAGGHGERLVGARPLVRVAQAAWGRGLVAAVRALAGAWQEEAAARSARPAPTTAGARRARLALLLTQPQVDLQVPGRLTESEVDQLRRWVEGLPAGRVRSVWPVLVENVGREGLWVMDDLLRSEVPAGLLARAARLEVMGSARTLRERPAALGRYLDCVEALLALNLPGVDVREEWLAGLFASGPGCMPGVVLTLLRRARGGEEGDRAAALQALGRDLGAAGPLADHARALARALEAWDAPEVAGTETVAALAGELGVEEAVVRRYLHHRRLAGHGETFPRGLLEPLGMAAREAGEADFLRRRLGEMPEDAPRRPYLAERLARLGNAGLAGRRKAEAVGRARRLLEQSMPGLLEESLERTLDDIYRTYLARLLGKPAPAGRLPAGVREALALLHAPQIDTALLLGFLDDVLQGRPLGDRGANRAWLARAAAAGVDVAAWRGGIVATVEVAGLKVTFATERDPLQVLRMGSYFGTCLSLGEGHNAASTLVNALDVNKQVVYGRRADGVVVARKLIGATAGGQLAGYRTYASEQVDACRRALGGVVAAFARRCGLRLADRATPEVLHAGFWYDDGNEPWETPGGDDSPGAAPDGAPADAAAVREWRLVEGVRGGDRAGLRAAVGGDGDEVGHAGVFRLMTDRPVGEPAVVFPDSYDVDRVAFLLASRGRLQWLDGGARFLSGGELPRLALELVGNLPWDAGVVSDAVRRVKQQAVSRRGEVHSPTRPSWACALAGTEGLIELYAATARMTCAECLLEELRRPGSWHRNRWAELLEIAYLRDHDSRSLVRAAGGETVGLGLVLAELACRQVIPGMAAALRSALGDACEGDDRLVLALGTQGCAADGPRLAALLGQRPRSLKRALAAVRCGCPEAAEAARVLWQPARGLPDDARAVGRLREVGSPRLARQVRGEVKDLARAVMAGDDVEALGKLGLLLRRAALLGLAGPDGEPAALLGPYLGEPAIRAARAWDAEVAVLQKTWQDVRDVDAQVARLRAGGAGPLAWLGALRQRVEGWPGAFRDERLEQALTHVLARGDDPRRAEAAELWLGGSPDGAGTGRVLALVGDAAALPWPVRERAVSALWGHTHFGESTSGWGEALVWLRGREWGVAGGAFEQDLRWERLNGTPAVAALLGLESPDPEDGRAVRGLLGWVARERPDYLLELLNLGFCWLRPEVIGPLAETLAAAVNVDRLGGEALGGMLLQEGTSWRWQRWAAGLARRQGRLRDDLEKKVQENADHPRAGWLLRELARQDGPAVSPS
jgi:hypothetical protein